MRSIVAIAHSLLKFSPGGAVAQDPTGRIASSPPSLPPVDQLRGRGYNNDLVGSAAPRRHNMIFETLTAGVVTAGSGRGFVVDGAGERLVITAAQCLPFLPPAQSFLGPMQRIYGPLLAPLGDAPRAWAVCRFVDPIADIAVLGSPDNPHADDYKALMERATPLVIGGSLRHPINFWLPARMLSLDGHRWFSCTIRHYGGPLWITHAAEGVRSAMAGSPIVTEIGTAIGVVCTAAAPGEGGPNARLTHNLPGWLLHDTPD
jgi:hypothetical protein